MDGRTILPRERTRPAPAGRSPRLLLASLLATGVACAAEPPPQPPVPPVQFGQDRAAVAPVDGERAHKHLVELCALGPRVSGTEGMRRQQKLLKAHFEQFGAAVTMQEFAATQKSQPRPVAMANLIAAWHPERAERIILCAHYDTRPSAHEEPNRADWNRPFVSANDGTSGVALLMELARHLKEWPTTVGVDVVLFDGEEYIFDPGVPMIREGDKYFLGSEQFARDYAKNRATRPTRYKAAVLLDLFAHPGARLAVEGYSLRQAPQLVDEIWRTAARVGAKSFRYERGFRRGDDVQDDHVPLSVFGGIPAVDILDFDYAHWHLLSDTPDKCSPAQMAEVGGVLLEWLRGK